VKSGSDDLGDIAAIRLSSSDLTALSRYLPGSATVLQMIVRARCVPSIIASYVSLKRETAMFPVSSAFMSLLLFFMNLFVGRIVFD
jgi:hypothetical protein